MCLYSLLLLTFAISAFISCKFTSVILCLGDNVLLKITVTNLQVRWVRNLHVLIFINSDWLIIFDIVLIQYCDSAVFFITAIWTFSNIITFSIEMNAGSIWTSMFTIDFHYFWFAFWTIFINTSFNPDIIIMTSFKTN